MPTLEKNMSTLMEINEKIVERLCLPVDGSHIHFLPTGEARYHLHRAMLPFVVEKSHIPKSIKDDHPMMVVSVKSFL